MEQQEQTEQQKKTGQRPIRILHLSDLHIGCDLGQYVRHMLWNDQKSVKNVKEFKSANSLFVEKFSERITSEIKCKEIDFVIFTGDFVINGSNGFEHKKASEIVKSFCQKIGFTDLNKVFIVPGNHDIDRTKVKLKGKKNNKSLDWKSIMQCHYKYFSEFYTDEYYKEYEIQYRDNNITIKNQKKLKEYLDLPNVSIIPLQTQLLTPYFSRDKIEPIKTFCKTAYNANTTNVNEDELNKFLWSNYDRGFIPEYQIDDISKKNINYNRINIALMHHNPIPIARKSNNYGTKIDYFPDSNYLANGPEVLNELMKKNINIILCGHSHQNSIVKHTNEHGDCLIISSLSCGEHDYSLGFNYIEIIPEDFTLKVIIQSHALLKINKWQCKKDEFILKVDDYESPFKNFSEGVNKLFNTVIDSNSKKHTILHYYYATKWDDYYKDILGVLIKNKAELSNCGKAFLELQDRGTRNNKLDEKTLVNAITDTITKQYLSEALVDYLKKVNFTERLIESITEKKDNHTKNMFLDKLKEMSKNEKEKRKLNYFIENVRCALENGFSIDKCVYFRIDSKNGSDTKNNQGVKDKFDWLINSIIAAKNANNNYNYAWLPYNIKGLEGESLIEITAKENESSEIIFGFSRSDEPHSKTVLYVNDKYYSMEAGAIITNVKSLAIKIIRPLSRYVMECFPFYKDGKLYLNNLEFVSGNLGITKNEWYEYAIRLRTVFTDSNKDIEIVEKSKREIKEDLKILKYWLWCFLNHKISENDEKCDLKDKFIPWSDSDINSVISNE